EARPRRTKSDASTLRLASLAQRSLAPLAHRTDQEPHARATLRLAPRHTLLGSGSWKWERAWQAGPVMPALRTQPLQIGPHSVWPPVVLAPMAGVTNAPFRDLCRSQGAGIYVSEMIASRGLVEGHEKTRKLARFGANETPRSIQLYGTDPGVMGAAVSRLVNELGAEHVDLNFGCPVRKVTRHGGGSALPWRRQLFAAVVRAAVQGAGDVPVTVKVRMGIDADHLTYLDAGPIAEAEGAAAVALHARTAFQAYSG